MTRNEAASAEQRDAEAQLGDEEPASADPPTDGDREADVQERVAFA